ncbi:MAG: hypothetical protein HY007_00670 [Candidatus Sungbacteria bacterium]|nr:hypothetical protein [Candidatus Sungbacteria bacterium]
MPPSQINQIIVNLIRTATQIIILLDIVAIMVFVWGIIKFIAAAGNPEQLKKSRAILWYGVIAFFVLASVTGIVLALQSYFGITGQPINIIPQLGPINIPSFTGSTGGYHNGGTGGTGGFPSGGSTGTSGGNGGSQNDSCSENVWQQNYAKCLECLPQQDYSAKEQYCRNYFSYDINTPPCHDVCNSACIDYDPATCSF